MTTEQPPAGVPPPPQPVVPMRNGFGITALCLAVPGILFGFVPITGFVAIILGALALIFGLLGVSRVRNGLADNKKMSWIATALAVLSLVMGVIATVMFVRITNDFVEDMNRISGQSAPQEPGQQRVEQAPPGAPVPAEPNIGSVPGTGEPPETVPPVAPPAPTQPPAPAEEVRTVTVKATGDLEAAEVYYTVGSQYGTTTEPLPFSVTEEVPGDAYTVPASIMVSAPMPEDFMNPPQGTVGCQVIVDGVTVDQNSANTGSSGSASVTCDQPGGS